MVGAFALAHSGTSHAANLLTEMVDNPVLSVMVFVLSHIFIIVLEGLVVFVQTSRLIVFEFFIRFLRAEGRVFKPLRGLR
jgi:V/A-type H+-transporting ATPase subunit I